MVFFFVTADGTTVYMGRDKYENEELLVKAPRDDIWFHVDEVSSAHVYIRTDGKGFEDLSAATIADCCQLVKGNSISGSKMADVTVIFTRVDNLRKDRTRMDVGTVGFVDERKVQRRKHVARARDDLKRIEKTRREGRMDEIVADRQRREREAVVRRKQEAAERAQREAEEERARKEREDLESYKGVMDQGDFMLSNAQMDMTAEEYEDDFI